MKLKIKSLVKIYVRSFFIVFSVFIILFSIFSIKFFFTERDLDKFRSPNLNYDWRFVDKIVSPESSRELPNSGGRTHNNSYFEILKRSMLCEMVYCFILTPAYPRSFKHEEGHIYTLEVLHENELIDYYINLLGKYNITTPDEELHFLEYYRYVTEGIAEYYTDDYFKDSYYTTFYKLYLKYVIKTSFKASQNSFYDGGNAFVRYLLENHAYKNLEGIIRDIGKEEQYNLFQDFKQANNLPDNEEIYKK